MYINLNLKDCFYEKILNKIDQTTKYRRESIKNLFRKCNPDCIGFIDQVRFKEFLFLPFSHLF